MAFEKYAGVTGGKGTYSTKPIGNVKYWEEELKAPVTAEIGRSPEELQRVYNQSRMQAAGSERAALDTMRGELGGLGFRGGESGIADTALGKISGDAQQQLGQFAMQQGINETNRRFDENMQLNAANLQRMGLGADMAAKMAATAASRAASMAGIKLGEQRLALDTEMGRGGLALSTDQFKYEREANTMKDLMSLFNSMGASQNQNWGAYNTTKGNAILS